MNKKNKLFDSLKIYRKSSVFFRDLIFALIIVAIPFSIMSTMLYNNGKKILERQVEESNRANLMRCSEIMDAMINEVDLIASYLSIKDEITFFAWEEKEKEVVEYINDLMKQTTFTRSYIDSYYIYSDVTKKVISGNGIYNINELKDNSWVQEYNLIEDLYASNIGLRKKYSKYPYLITVIKPILSASSSVKTGAVVINIDVEKLVNMLGSNQNNRNFMVLDCENAVIYADDYKEISEKPISISEDNGLNYTDDGKNIVSVCYSEKFNDWKYALKSPIETYTDEFHSLFYNVRIFICFAILFTMILAVSIALRSFSVIKTIMQVFEEKGIYNYDENKSVDELDFIISNIASQIELNKDMRREVIAQFGEMRKAQTAALQAQITPHFLRNTLEVINFKAFECFDGVNPVSDMISILGKMINNFIDSKDYIVTIKEECEYTKIYIQLLCIRYESMLEVQWDVDEKLLDDSIVKLTMQPIIENSIIHGLKRDFDDGILKISLHEISDNNILLSIEDNGKGISDEEIIRINTHMKEDIHETKNVGMYNVNRRYKIIFGKEYGIEVKKSELGGACTNVMFPKKI